MPLSSLLDGLLCLPAEADIGILHLTLDSRTVRAGSLFFALSGSQQDGRRFIPAAVAAGATAVCQDGDHLAIEWLDRYGGACVPLITLPGLAGHLGTIAARFRGLPSAGMHMTAVTGTNGKSSVTWWLVEAWRLLGKRAGVIGTIGYGATDQLTESTHTTPDALRLQGIFDELRSQQIDHVALEASSHALDQQRLHGLTLDTVLFLPVSHDHLDYHSTMAAYRAAKLRLLTDFTPRLVVAVSDDEPTFTEVERLTAERHIPLWALACDKRLPARWQGPYYQLHSCELHGEGFQVRFNSHLDTAPREQVWPFLARFQVMNALMVLATLCAQGVSEDEVLATLPSWGAIPGRMHWIRLPEDRHAIIDYAHTPDAVAQVLTSLRQRCIGRLTVVFGCGGERDADKRPQMGAIAAQHADHIILTHDNPRHENPDAIVRAIAAGIPADAEASHEVVADRARAIRQGLSGLQPGGWLAILGKGHETVQIVGDERQSFSDEAVVNDWLSS